MALYNSGGLIESGYVGWEKTTRIVLMNTGLIIFVPSTTLRVQCPSDAVEDPAQNAMFAKQVLWIVLYNIRGVHNYCPTCHMSGILRMQF